MAAQQDPQIGSINVVVEYKIENSTDNSIRHGWVKIQDMKVERSFLGFENENEAKKVHKNLSELQGVSFLKSYFIIEHGEHYWLAVDKIQYSLEKYKREHSRIWNGSRLVSQYQDIIRSENGGEKGEKRKRERRERGGEEGMERERAPPIAARLTDRRSSLLVAARRSIVSAPPPPPPPPPPLPPPPA
ncbi:hypothetical protein ACSBR1_014415 [Camellia fascicularis]